MVVAARVRLRHLALELVQAPIRMDPQHGRDRHHPLVKRGLHPLASARLLPRVQRRENPNRHQVHRARARHRAGQKDRPLTVPVLLVLLPRPRLHERIPARPPLIATARGVRRDGHVDQVRELLLQRVIVQPQPRHDPRRETLRDHVRGRHELQKLRFAFRRLEIQGHRPPAAVPDPVAVVAPVRVATRRLHFDHVRPVLSQQQNARRAGHAPGQIQNTNSLKCVHW